MSDQSTQPPARPGRVCPQCGGGLRLSHRAYTGGGRSVDVLRCGACGLICRGAERESGEAERRGAEQARERRERAAARAGRSGQQRRGRRPLDEGAPDNPVIDEQTASLLLEGLEG